MTDLHVTFTRRSAKKLLALILCVCMCFSMMDGLAYAQNDDVVQTVSEDIQSPSEGTGDSGSGIQSPSEGTGDSGSGTQSPSSGTEEPKEDTEQSPSSGTEEPKEDEQTPSEGTTCDHIWDAGKVTTAATCTGKGEIVYTCTVCGETKREEIAATGHSIVTDAAVSATCTKTGLTAGSHCSVCGAVITAQKMIAATGHNYSAWTTKTEATVFAAETQTHTCSACGATETRTVGSALTPTIKLNATSLKLKVNQSTTKLKVSGLANGDYVTSWKSSNKKIATVNKNGKITAKKAGTAKITVTLASGKKKTIKVTVQKTAVKCTGITVTKSKITIKKGKTAKISTTIKPITCLQKVTYTSSNKKVATVNSKGKITAKKAGTAKITIKCGSKKKVVTVKVTK